MNPLLAYPFDPQVVLKRRKSIRRELLAEPGERLQKRIAVLGGSTTHDIVATLELFLLDAGIQPVFYESEFGLYYEEGLFGEELERFAPELIFVHTSRRNLTELPAATDSDAEVEAKLERAYGHFETLWEGLRERFHVPVIQNNFELPFYRTLGNRDAWDPRGQTHFVERLNGKLAAYAAAHSDFYLHDIRFLSADYGLLRWSDPFYWHMYKYCLCLDAIPAFAYSLAGIIRSLYGRKKKALVLDLDNTLWGGVVGDDGVEGIEIGHETSMGQVYSEFQAYLKELKSWGVLLTVASKNDEENALAGLNHPEGTLRPEDLVLLKANWEPKDRSVAQIAQELNLLPDSLVFVDDNPAERAIVTAQVPEVQAPPLDAPEHAISLLDRAGYFEATELSQDDLGRSAMYRANAQRAQLEKSFASYEDYLRSLDMHAQIRPFEGVYLARIAQLTNKSNQFNLTTRRYSESQLQQAAQDPGHVTLYGKLTDRFGDNGVVSVVMGRWAGTVLDIELWLMSCRVLKRGMEYAMLDELVRRAREAGGTALRGTYLHTAKNGMVRDLYRDFGFTQVSADGEDTVWELELAGYRPQNHVIQVNEVQ